MKKKNNMYKLLIAVILFMGIGYAIVTSTLHINGAAIFSSNKWEIKWDNINITNNVTYQDETTGDDKVGTVTYGDEAHTSINYEAALLIPGDKFEFTVDMFNNGTMPAIVEVVDRSTNMKVNEIDTNEYSRWFNYSINYTDGKVIKPMNTLMPQERRNVTVTLELKADIQNEDLQKLPSTFTGGISIKFVQYAKKNARELPCTTTGEIALGSEVTCANEVFNVISVNGDSYKLLSKYNLDLENDKQSSTAGTILYSKNSYWWDTENNDISSTYTNNYVFDSNSKVYDHLNNYKNFLYINDVDGEVRLLQPTDFNSSICSYDLINNVSECDTTTYEFVNNTSTWTGIAVDSSKIVAYNNTSGFERATHTTSDVYGIRPVVVLDKKYIEVK